MLYSFWENTFLFFRDDFTAVLVLKFDGSQIGFWVHDDVFSEGIAFNFESFGCQTRMAILDVDKKQKRDQKKTEKNSFKIWNIFSRNRFE